MEPPPAGTPPDGTRLTCESVLVPVEVVCEPDPAEAVCESVLLEVVPDPGTGVGTAGAEAFWRESEAPEPDRSAGAEVLTAGAGDLGNGVGTTGVALPGSGPAPEAAAVAAAVGVAAAVVDAGWLGEGETTGVADGLGITAARTRVVMLTPQVT